MFNLLGIIAAYLTFKIVNNPSDHNILLIFYKIDFGVIKKV